MASCININSVEFQTLKKKSGLSDFQLKAYSRPFLDKYGRFPYLDELPGSNSEPHLRESIDLKGTGAKIDKILEATGAQSIEEANIALNNDYRDLEINITPLIKEAHIEVEHRPTNYSNEDSLIVEFDDKINSAVLLNQTLSKLAKLYGVQMIPITTDELNTEKWKGIVSDAKQTSAFVYQGNIYINTDVADVDAPLHEMMHLFFGSIRFTNPDLYVNLLQSVQKFDNYKLQMRAFAGRTQNDIAEEVLVNEFSKYLTGMPSQLDGIDEATKYEIFYNMNRVFDSVLMGENSVNIVDKSQIGNMTLRDLAKKVKSSILTNNFKGSLDDESLHRIMMNTKASLMREHKLEEYCE